MCCPLSLLGIWDTRKLHGMPMTLLDQAAQETAGELTHGALDFDAGVNMSSTKGKGAFTAEFFTANLPAQLIGI